MIRILHSVLPLSERRGGVSARFESLGTRHLIQVERFAAGRSAEDAAPIIVSTGQKFSLVGEHTGQTLNRWTIAPSCTNESIFGVVRFVFP